MSSLLIDPKTLTIGDMEDFESIAGIPLQEAFKGRPVKDDDGVVQRDERGRPIKAVQPTATELKAIIYIIKRQDNPAFTVEDARNTTISELEILTGPGPEAKPDPKVTGA